MRKKHRLIALCLLTVFLFTACGHEHSFDDWETESEPGCEQPGYQVRTCECGEEEKQEIPPEGHVYNSISEVVVSCEVEGVEKFTCKNCEHSYSATIPAWEHEYVLTETVPPSCRESGSEVYHCDRCDTDRVDPISMPTYTSTELYEKYVDSVGEIVIYDSRGNELGLGSCFVYTAEGYLVTNFHVMQDAYSATVTLGDKTYDIKEVLAYDKDIDVAVVKISARDLTPVTICKEDHRVGETVYAFGNSQGLTSTFSDGMITYSNREVDGVQHVQHDAPISGGNSGGPLINIYGEVIGINTWTYTDSQNLNFAIHMSELDKLNYSNPMTLEEFYDAEGNAFGKAAEYIAENGSYDEDGFYTLYLDYYSDGSYDYILSATYVPGDEYIMIDLSVDQEIFTYVLLDEELSGIYEWGYMDDWDDSVTGIVYAGTFDGQTTLSYTDYDLADNSLLTDICEFSTNMLDVICRCLDDSFASAGVTALDFGFYYY